MWDKIIESLQQRWEACYYLFADARAVRAHQAFLDNNEKYQAEVRPRLAKKGIAKPTREQFLAEYALIISEGLSDSFSQTGRLIELRWSGTSL